MDKINREKEIIEQLEALPDDVKDFLFERRSRISNCPHAEEAFRFADRLIEANPSVRMLIRELHARAIADYLTELHAVANFGKKDNG
ncbi:MAG: hypothetical protein ING71_16680 [Rhodocyclaceae bacterium]|nr:hypothetical protein [Rhodocyclaceae bacterium]